MRASSIPCERAPIGPVFLAILPKGLCKQAHQLVGQRRDVEGARVRLQLLNGRGAREAHVDKWVGHDPRQGERVLSHPQRRRLTAQHRQPSRGRGARRQPAIRKGLLYDHKHACLVR
eukprot:scaffold150582_cov27-Tisochrysis_lutea.AAC.2